MQKRNGQVGLLLLVIMGLVVGIALSLASRSLGDTVLSRQESESSKAFRLAESGIEQALNQLRQGTLPESLSLGDDVFSGSTSATGQTSFGLYVKEGEQAHLDTTGYTGSLRITWTKTNDNRENPDTCLAGSGRAPAAIEIITHQSDGSASFAYYNPNDCTPENNAFESALPGSDGYNSVVTSYPVVAGTTAVRIRPIYNDATIEVTGGAGLSTQLYLIQSQASGGDAQKEIEVKRGLDAPASVFDYALFSGAAIEKN